MCGRFNVSSTPGLQTLLDSLGVNLQVDAPRFNIAPTESISLVHGAQGEAIVEPARWWLTPHWSKEVSQKYAMFNARSEGLTQSPAFRKPFASQRGIVPVSEFIEWRGDKASRQPWLISNEERALALAALWDIWKGPQGPMLSCSLVTTEAARPFRPWHGRMPVMLAEDDRERWLDNTGCIAADDALFSPTLAEVLVLTPIDKSVGNARNKDQRSMSTMGESVRLQPDRVAAGCQAP